MWPAGGSLLASVIWQHTSRLDFWFEILILSTQPHPLNVQHPQNTSGDSPDPSKSEPKHDNKKPTVDKSPVCPFPRVFSSRYGPTYCSSRLDIVCRRLDALLAKIRHSVILCDGYPTIRSRHLAEIGARNRPTSADYSPFAHSASMMRVFTSGHWPAASSMMRGDPPSLYPLVTLPVPDWEGDSWCGCFLQRDGSIRGGIRRWYVLLLPGRVFPSLFWPNSYRNKMVLITRVIYCRTRFEVNVWLLWDCGRSIISILIDYSNTDLWKF